MKSDCRQEIFSVVVRTTVYTENDQARAVCLSASAYSSGQSRCGMSLPHYYMSQKNTELNAKLISALSKFGVFCSISIL